MLAEVRDGMRTPGGTLTEMLEEALAGMLDVLQALRGGYMGWIGDAVRDCMNTEQSANCITGAS